MWHKRTAELKAGCRYKRCTTVFLWLLCAHSPHLLLPTKSIMSSSIILITGGNTGIGYETVKALYTSSQPYTILMGSRSLEKADTAITQLKSEVPESKNEVVAVQIDIEDDESIEKAFKEVQEKWGRLEGLVNNAGAAFDAIMLKDPSPKGMRAAWDKAYSLNVTSTQVMTHTFAPLLIASSNPRLLFLTSGLASLETCAKGMDSKLASGPPPKGWPKPQSMASTAYRSSKTALNMMMLYWKKTLEVDGVKTFSISPGFLATGLGGVGPDVLRKVGAGDPGLGGALIRDVLEGKRDGDAGVVVSQNGVQPW
ncbi:Short-chain dehydrogenase [Pyrenophora seminiperda CCB06]|uniref:Short-chain dehydrogenase n=1 Tax=Pyrenophora seminiperda CCB06 TaxID=1302712 RepID=A0A3M7MFY9_9PLEO|nr:Short-chain dehydrogenase [Pyrenophora seminiperda CCB06]